MFGWHHWPKGHDFEKALGDGEGQGRLVCCSSWSRKESDRTWQLNNNKIIFSCITKILFVQLPLISSFANSMKILTIKSSSSFFIRSKPSNGQFVFQTWATATSRVFSFLLTYHGCVFYVAVLYFSPNLLLIFKMSSEWLSPAKPFSLTR